MRTRRAILYVPGDNQKRIEEAAKSGVDSICLDLEDSVALSSKNEARQITSDALQNLDFGVSERLVRINPVDSGMAQADLAAVLPALPNGIVIPDVQSPSQIHWVSRQISNVEQKYDWPENSMVLLALIESAKAIIRLQEICSADERLVGLMFGADDLAVDIGAMRTINSMELVYPRSAIVLHSAAFGLQAIDLVNVNFEDIKSVRREARQGQEMGFTGKQILHPSQIVPVQEAFTPNAWVIENAKRLVETYQRQEKQGVGSFELDGNIINRRVIRAAERLLKRVRETRDGISKKE